MCQKWHKLDCARNGMYQLWHQLACSLHTNLYTVVPSEPEVARLIHWSLYRKQVPSEAQMALWSLYRK